MSDVRSLLDQPLLITEKLDGSNTCWTRDDFFARSHSGAPGHPSFDAAKSQHARIRHLIPKHLSVFGEWCFAVHSIEYDRLPGWLNIFAVRNDESGMWWSWDDIEMMSEALGVATVPVLARSQVHTERELQSWTMELAQASSVYGKTREGIVVRNARCFPNEDFEKNLAKIVRKNHVQTDEHWSHQQVRKQKLSV